MTDKLNIYQKLVEVRKGIASFKKDTQGYNFTYVSGTQVLSAIKEDLDKQGIILEQHLINPTAENGVVSSAMKMIWVNAEKPEDRIEIPWFMVGTQKDLSQSFGSGLTYAERYFMLKFFNIPTDKDDPDGLNKGKNTGKSTGNPGADKTQKLDERIVTEKQINFYHVQVKKANVEADKYSDRVKKQFNVDSKKKLKRWQFDKVIEELELKIKTNEQQDVTDDFNDKFPEGE